jgi:hypothetical protein
MHFASSNSPIRIIPRRHTFRDFCIFDWLRFGLVCYGRGLQLDVFEKSLVKTVIAAEPF